MMIKISVKFFDTYMVFQEDQIRAGILMKHEDTVKLDATTLHVICSSLTSPGRLACVQDRREGAHKFEICETILHWTVYRNSLK